MKKLFCFSLFLCLLIVGCQKDNALSTLGNDPITTTQNEATTAVSPALATKAATLFFTEQAPQSKSTPKTIASIRTLFAEDGTPSMYVINYVQGGFVIVSATKEYYPILAYSDENRFELNPQNGGATDWVNQTKYAINHSNELPDSTQSKIFTIWQHYDPQPQATEGAASKASTEEDAAIYDRISAMRSAYPGYSFRPLSGCSPSTFPVNSGIYEALCNYANECSSPYEYTIVAIKDIIATSTTGHLLSTKWDQRNSFNDLNPPGCPAGCDAIAMAQIMKYYHHPAGYNWGNMPATTATISTQTLIADIGKAVDMQYTPTSSTSNHINATNAFRNVFGYNVQYRGHSLPEVQTEVYTYRRPVYMRGTSTTGGHAWVCDGVQYTNYTTQCFAEYQRGGSGYYYYSTHIGPSANNPLYTERVGPTFLSMNWGWGGRNDGWFGYDQANPSGGEGYNNSRVNLYISK